MERSIFLLFVSFLFVVGCVSQPVLLDEEPSENIVLVEFPAVWTDRVEAPIEVELMSDTLPPARIYGLQEEYQPLNAASTSSIMIDLIADLQQLDPQYDWEDCLDDAVIFIREDNIFLDECGSSSDSVMACFQAPGLEHHIHSGAYAIVVRQSLVFEINGVREKFLRHEFLHRALECVSGDPDGEHTNSEFWDLAN
ncbi:MAG: hypothetical protein WC761_00680 [Candidatus Paceibacterota bacterium]|jgi:hypothetical protein